jgi:hypothetical protein
MAEWMSRNAESIALCADRYERTHSARRPAFRRRRCRHEPWARLRAACAFSLVMMLISLRLFLYSVNRFFYETGKLPRNQPRMTPHPRMESCALRWHRKQEAKPERRSLDLSDQPLKSSERHLICAIDLSNQVNVTRSEQSTSQIK